MFMENNSFFLLIYQYNYGFLLVIFCRALISYHRSSNLKNETFIKLKIF